MVPEDDGPGPSVRTLTDNLDFVSVAVQSMGDVVGLNTIELAVAWKAVRLLTAGLKEANTFQKQSLSLNKTLTQVLGKNTRQIASLAGGLYENAQSVFELQRAGFDKLNPRMVQLGTFMRNSGQSTAGLIEQSKLLYNQGGLTENSINALAENLMYNTAQYNITTTELIGAVNQLSGKMATFGMLGIAGPLSEAVVDLTARMGAQFGDSIGKFATMMADPGTSSTLLQRLGLYDMAQEIRLGKVDDKKLLEAIQQASRGTERFTGGTAGKQGEIFTRMLGIAGGEGGLGQLGMQLGREDVAPEGGPMALVKSMDELGIIFREVIEPMKIGIAAIFETLVPIFKGISPLLRKLAVFLFPFLIARVTALIVRIIWATTAATYRFVKGSFKHFQLMLGLGSLKGSIDANTASQRTAGAGSIVGALVGITVAIIGVWAAAKASAKMDEEMLKMQRDAELEEQRKQAKDVPRTAGFLAMAKAIAADAGLAMAFRPDVLDPARRDALMDSAIDIMKDIDAGVRIRPTETMSIIMGGGTPIL